MFNRWDIIISGFTQDRSEPNGSERLWGMLYHALGGNSVVQMHTWNDDWPALAAFIFRNARLAHRRINVYAYSWGGGWGFTRLARELGKRGLVIDRAVLCDAVYRSPFLPAWLPLNPLSMLRLPTITIPANVRMVDWFYQTQTRPMGHRLRAEDDERTIIHEGVELHAAHRWMDTHPAYHQQALEAAGL